MRTFTHFLLATLLTASLALAGKEGSTGTTGGGDTIFDPFELIPSVVVGTRVLELRSRHDQKIEIGKKRCWKFIPCPVYARQIIITYTFEKEAFRRTKSGISSTIYAKNGSMEKRLDPSEDQPETFFERFYSYSNARTTYLWDKEELSPKAFEERVESVWNVALSQLNFEVPQTVVGAQVIGLFRNRVSGGAYQHELQKRLGSFVATRSDEIHVLASKVVDDQGVCNLDLYAQLRAKLRRWTTGSRKWFAKFTLETGLEIDDSTLLKSIQHRGWVREFISDEVEPYCSEAYQQTTSNPEKETVIVTEE